MTSGGAGRGGPDGVDPGQRNPEQGRTPEQLDALLDGGASGAGRLDKLILAARAPGRPDELGGLAAAAAAMASPPTALTRTRRGLVRVGAATLATKIATAAVGAAAVGGVAVAAATGHLPGQPHQHRGHGAPTGSRTADPSAPTTSGSTHRSGATSGSGSPASSTSAPDGAAAVPTLCRQWLASTSAHDAPRFRVLIRVAGGAPAVTEYCLSLPSSSGASLSPSRTSPGATQSHSSSASEIRPSPSRTRVNSASVRPSSSSSSHG